MTRLSKVSFFQETDTINITVLTTDTVQLNHSVTLTLHTFTC